MFQVRISNLIVRPLLIKVVNMNRLKELRIKHGLNQKEVADALDTTQQAISNYERGDREPKMETWQKLADYFDVSVPYIRGDINTELIAKIAKMIFLTHATDFDVYLNQNDLFTGYSEDDTTIACKLMLLLLQQLNLNISEEYEKIVDKTEKILGKSDSDPAVNCLKTKQYLSDITDGCSENNFEKDIEDAKKLIDFYDKL